MIYDLLANIGNYRGMNRDLGKAIDYLMAMGANTLPLGRTETGGDRIFLQVMEIKAHEPTDESYEVHRNYMDIQIDVDGCEVIETALNNAVPIGEYRPDFQKAAACVGAGGHYVMGPGKFILCTAGEARGPGGYLKQPKDIKECVVKVTVTDEKPWKPEGKGWNEMDKTELFNHIKGELIISCQTLPGEPLYDPECTPMPYMARAAREARSLMIRINTVRDVVGIKRETGLPVIGLIKQAYERYDRYITPTMQKVDALAEAGADIITVDCIDRKRGDGLSPWEYTGTIRERCPDQILMANISDYQKEIQMQESGIDLTSTITSGYTDYTPRLEGPDFKLVRRLPGELPIPVIGKGCVHTPEEAVRVLDMGAWAIIVGGVITRPLEITERFMKAVNGRTA